MIILRKDPELKISALVADPSEGSRRGNGLWSWAHFAVQDPDNASSKAGGCLFPHHVAGLPASVGHIGGPQLQVLQLMGGGGGGRKS